MAKEATSLGANTFQFFTRNPRGCKAKDIDASDVSAFEDYCKNSGIKKFLAHAPYTLNFCAAKPYIREFAVSVLSDDLARMESTPGQMYNMHPGSHVGQGVEVAVDFISQAINQALGPEHTTTLLLETMAGKGSEVGRTFEELRAIIDRVELSHKIGVCLDTCHVWDGGYDIKNNLDGVLEEFDKVIGLDWLCAIHINDSKNDLGSHKDRHEVIGEGFIGFDAFERIINHPALRDLPFYLETPHDKSSEYADEISALTSAYQA